MNTVNALLVAAVAGQIRLKMSSIRQILLFISCLLCSLSGGFVVNILEQNDVFLPEAVPAYGQSNFPK